VFSYRLYSVLIKCVHVFLDVSSVTMEAAAVAGADVRHVRLADPSDLFEQI